MKEPKTPTELAEYLRWIAYRGIFPLRAEERKVLEVSARYIEHVAEDGWHDAIKDPPTIGGTYLCSIIYPDRTGGFVKSQNVLMWDRENHWHCEDMIVTHWHEKLPFPRVGFYA